MRYLATLISISLIAPTTFAVERRAADAHVHGASMLNIAIDGPLLALEFEAPGMDLVGFEHAPTTDAQHQRIEDAMAALNAPETLFGLPNTAQCARTQTTVHGPEHKAEHTEAKGHEHGKSHAHEAEHTEAKGHEHGKSHAHEAEHTEAKGHEHGTPHGHDTKHTEIQADTHSEFHAVYQWSCKEMGALKMLTPTLFTRFPGMQTITVEYATPNGQGTLEVTATTPGVRLP
jgi:hypothetical protein